MFSASLLLLAGAAAAQTTLTVMVANNPDSYFTLIDSAPAGDSFGDLEVWRIPVYAFENFDAALPGDELGQEQGQCIIVAGDYVDNIEYECSWTNSFDDVGSMTVQGRWMYDSAKAEEFGVLAITGGTGVYVGARGEVHVSCPEDAEAALNFCEYQFEYTLDADEVDEVDTPDEVDQVDEVDEEVEIEPEVDGPDDAGDEIDSNVGLEPDGGDAIEEDLESQADALENEAEAAADAAEAEADEFEKELRNP